MMHTETGETFDQRDVEASIRGAEASFAATRSIMRDQEIWTPAATATEIVRISLENLARITGKKVN
jgi:hypothetical protein